MLQKRNVLKIALLVLSSFPVLLFAYLGLHTRLIHDDFGVSAVGLEYGAWDGLIRYYNRWTSAYSSIFLRLSLAEHAVALPPLVTCFIIGIWLLSLVWLSRQLFTCLNVIEHRGRFAIGASALVVAAAINAFYTPESFYWYSANMQYTVPLAVLVGCLALASWTVRHAEMRRRLIWGTAACALISFLTAGASEMFLVFQLTFLTLLAALAWAVVDRPRRRALAFVAGAILFATAVGLIVQLSSPGIWNRMEADAANYRPPDSLCITVGSRYDSTHLREHRQAGSHRRFCPASWPWNAHRLKHQFAGGVALTTFNYREIYSCRRIWSGCSAALSSGLVGAPKR